MPNTDPNDGCVIVLGQNIWGRGKTVKEAIAQFGTTGGNYVVYFCGDPTAEVDEMGNIVQDKGFHRPYLVGKYKNGKPI